MRGILAHGDASGSVNKCFCSIKARIFQADN
jgi:hypothetical protein